MTDRVLASAIPPVFHAEWRVVGFIDPDGTRGPTDDVWSIQSDRIDTPDGELMVREVIIEIEADQDSHLVNFSNNCIQCAFLRSNKQPETVLAVWYLGGTERRRFLLRQSSRFEQQETKSDTRKPG
jgi:hypothetical protein